MSELPTERSSIEARLSVWSTADGGRAAPVFAGYRASWRVPQPDGSLAYTDGAVYPVAADALAPGATGIVQIYPVRPESWQAVPAGTQLEMCEGPRVVGIATVAREHTRESSRLAPVGAVAGLSD